MVAALWSPGLTDVVAVSAHIAISGIVTAHVLLKKRDVRAALGWIAVAWLSPIVGGLLYYLFGINRVTRRAVQLENLARERGAETGAHEQPTVSAHIAALAEIGKRVTGSPLVAGNRVSIYHGGDEAYPAMLAAIRDARRSIALAAYIFRDDSVGRSFVEALVEARSRGVAVRVLLDGIGGGYLGSPIWRKLKAGHVSAARFLHTWVPWRMPFLNMRNHKKLLIVDGETGFTGGLNIGAENSARLTSKDYVDDIHARVNGPIVSQLMETFARDWSFANNEALVEDIWWPSLGPEGPVYARGIRSGPDADIDKLEAILGAALTQAQERVRIVTPYFLPDQRLQFALAQARLRGVSVEILISEKSDYPFMDWATRAHLGFFDAVSVSVYLGARPFDHAKLMTVDGQWCLIGSSNWDVRSLRLNFEFDLECYDRDLTAKINAIIDKKIARSRRLDQSELASRPRWTRLRDAAVRLFLPYL